MSSREEHTELLSSELSILVSKAHIFTSDSIILADFSAPRKKDKCCDLGAGNGIIPLLWYRDVCPAEIVGVELSESAVDLFRRTLIMNNIAGKINVINADLRDIKGLLPNEYFDLVTINPPYKKLGTGKVNAEADYKNARHEFTCTVFNAAKCASQILKFGGKFCICQRPERLVDVFEAMRKYKLEPKAMREVIQRSGAKPSLVLIEAKKGGSPGLTVMPPLFIENNNGEYSEEANKLFNAYKFK